MARKPKTISDQVRQAIDASGLTRYEIAKRAGIDQSALSKFYHGQRGITTETLDKIAKVLGLRITIDRKLNKKDR